MNGILPMYAMLCNKSEDKSITLQNSLNERIFNLLHTPAQQFEQFYLYINVHLISSNKIGIHSSCSCTSCTTMYAEKAPNH
jgi:hypothetical protein